MRKILLATLIALPVMQAIASEPVTWRVAGIMQGGAGGVAIMESSTGEQSLFRAGDAVADARVASIGAAQVVLELDNRQIVLALRGSSHALLAGSADAAANGEASTQAVAGRYAAQRLQQLLKEATDESQLQAGAAKLSRLPKGASITSINHGEAAPVRVVLARMVEYLELGRTVSLEFDGEDGQGSMYIYPDG